MKLTTQLYTPASLAALKKEQPRQFVALKERARRELINGYICQKTANKTVVFDLNKIALAFGQGDGCVTADMKQRLIQAAERENRQGQALPVYSFI